MQDYCRAQEQSWKRSTLNLKVPFLLSVHYRVIKHKPVRSTVSGDHGDTDIYRGLLWELARVGKQSPNISEKASGGIQSRPQSFRTRAAKGLTFSLRSKGQEKEPQCPILERM